MEQKDLPVEGLLDVFRGVPDPRRAQGRRHPLPGILAMSVAAMLCGARSLYAIYQWGREQDKETLCALGLTHSPSPSVATLHRVFTRLEARAFEEAVRNWASAHLVRGEEAVAIDGKSLRGIHGETLPGVHLVAMYAHDADLVLAQLGGKGQERG